MHFSRIVPQGETFKAVAELTEPRADARMRRCECGVAMVSLKLAVGSIRAIQSLICKEKPRDPQCMGTNWGIAAMNPP